MSGSFWRRGGTDLQNKANFFGSTVAAVADGLGEGTMDFGIALPTAADSWKVVQRAEELGFTHAWFYDTQMLSADCFVAMGAAAVNTRRIRLGPGVLVPSNGIAPVTANAL